ncbi:DUF4426 domain-containing protein [Sessilibacter corallicola]|uniref:DUF4426 domain-containing protein n=1 Tax=Sessilibacter corallicola TaxID=2904075 RepID=A0ABQ0A5V1_9GAMM
MKTNTALIRRNYLLITALILAVFTSHSHADVERFWVERGYKVIYSVFNSKFLTPEIASEYGLKRNGDLTLLNVVVTKDGEEVTTLGLPAELEGSARNLLQQKQALKFLRIKEANTVYYIAPIKHHNEEVYNFDLKVLPDGETKPIRIQFSKKLYSDR